MSAPDEILEHLVRAGGRLSSGEPRTIAAFAEPAGEYEPLRDGPALAYRAGRAILELTGRDRAPWLHNLVTNQVTALSPGDGVYAFVLNVKGRILFDLNVLVLRESIRLDLDRRFVQTALTHFDKYHITEDIHVVDRSPELAQFALAGSRAVEVLTRLGASHAGKMPVLGVSALTWRDQPLTFVRHDFCGPFSVTLHVPRDRATAFWDEFTGHDAPGRTAPVGEDAVQIHRIESGIPWPGQEITEACLPAETGQLGRAVSFNKGCYLGQEIVERMRARGSLARVLCGVRLEGDPVPPAGARVLDSSGKPIGELTSADRSPALGCPIALGYLKTAAAQPDSACRVEWEGGAADGRIVKLPFVRHGEP